MSESDETGATEKVEPNQTPPEKPKPIRTYEEAEALVAEMGSPHEQGR